MPRVNKDERYVEVGYHLMCGYERAEALAQALYEFLKEDEGFYGAEDDTRGWDGPREALVKVTYYTLQDANRLDATVREQLSRKVDFTYESKLGYSYGSRGATAVITASTTVTERDAT